MTQPLDIARYMALNESYGEPLIFTLTRRGMFSEVNCLLGAMIYALLEKRRLIVDTVPSTGMPWSDLYVPPLPTASAAVKAQVRDEWRLLGTRSANFQTIRDYVMHLHTNNLPVLIDGLDIAATMFDTARAFAAAFCVPIPDVTSVDFEAFIAAHNLREKPFAAFHVRKGDKITGYKTRDGQLVIESKDISVDAFFQLLGETHDAIERVYVITDDYAAVEETADVGRRFGKEVISIATPAMRGYDNATFQGQPEAVKLQQLRDFLAQMNIAAMSDIFIGSFKSNVGRYLALLHHNPKNCRSVDEMKAWRPS